MADKKNTKENELDKLFDPNNSNDSFSKIIGKARRRSIIRNILISISVLFFLIILVGFSWLSIMRWSETNAIRDIELFNRITNPNVEESGSQQQGNSFFEGILRFNRYKEVEGIPVDWSEEVMTYSLFGGVSGFAGSHSPVQLQEEGEDQVNVYDRETKQRMMSFYHPKVAYDQLANGVKELENYPEDTVAEVALSFDQTYSPSEIEEAMPEEINVKWHWTDTYSAADIERKNEGIEEQNGSGAPELATQIYGFDASMEAEGFIDTIETGLSIENGKYVGEYERIHNNLTEEDSRLTEENVEVIGAVVTGSVEDLQLLEDSTMIRSSTLGVTANPYQ
ncbi:sigma factor regulator [Sinobaca qinghaiensis]|uniref:Sigma factor regulator n=1 Tax=Sinobaca qinghaiensis TaxID=342944 RepID=A0A419UWU9_9BACL|nr:anti sigma factor C-terminal domain-containing protein [Sinobaca qinghaiensis]RKD69596.1 sigma factor regulator [Sinobaca qinghaiensis]